MSLWTAAGLVVGLIVASAVLASVSSSQGRFEWISPNRYRIPLNIECRGASRSQTPCSVDIDFRKALAGAGEFDEHTVEVIAYDSSGKPRVFDGTKEGYERFLLPCRIDPYFGADHVTLNFAVPDGKSAAVYAYFDTVESGNGKPKRYAGLVGDGDFFRIGYSRREVGPSFMCCFYDFDGDGDLDLFKVTNEPYIYCYENVGENRFVYRGRMASGNKVFTLPNGPNFRSWPTITFDDWDGDGKADLFACCSDGPEAGHVIVYENVTKPGGPLELEFRGRLLPASGAPMGGTWFPSVTIVDYDGDGKRDVIVGRDARLEFYRNIGESRAVGEIRLADPVEIPLSGESRPTTRRADFVDMDGDGDLDLLVSMQGSDVQYYENVGTRTRPVYAEPVVLPNCGGGHNGVKAADFDGDGMIEYAFSSAWAGKARLYKNAGTPKKPRWEEKDAQSGCPYTECFQICDMSRQNTIRVTDWDNDGRLDLIASGERGTVKLFRNTTNNLWPVFAEGVVVLDDLGPGVRSCICDWNNDGKKDLVVTNWFGKVFVHLNQGTDAAPAFGEGIEVLADGKSFSAGDWASVLVCDWDGDGKKDIIFGQAAGRQNQAHWPHKHEDPAKDQGFLFYKNIGTDAEPVFGFPEWVEVGDAGGKSFDYLRPNLGSFIDWDGDGKKDFIVGEFENAIHLYRNVGPDRPGEPPRLDGGIMIIRASTDQVISGVDVVDWNGDGKLDIVTGQGHGGSGLRYFIRDYIDDCLNGTRPTVRVGRCERKAD